MKICVVLPLEGQRDQAGVRIRYGRLQPYLEKHGHFLAFRVIQEFAENCAEDHDVYLISKCYDARALILTHQLRAAGKLVGVDLFDDYFSDNTDSRLINLRYWLRGLCNECSFILCSTSGMGQIARSYTSELPIHVLNDPAPAVDVRSLAEHLAHKFDIARDRKRLTVAWFGIGDNPSYPVGLTDLAAFGSEIDRLRGHGYQIELEILTNQRAMTADNLAQLKRLATPYRIDEWSEAAEAELLSRSLLAFLPVNAQPFSRVKSLNRAVTALTSGTQVFSVGFPLYAALDPFIYRNGKDFLRDLGRTELRLRPTTMPAFVTKLHELANVEREATRFIQFIQTLTPRHIDSANSDKQNYVSLIHGKDTIGDTHKFARKRGALSVASPFSRQDLSYDVRVRFSLNEPGLEVLVSSQKIAMVASDVKEYFVHHGAEFAPDYHRLYIPSIFPDISVPVMTLANNDSLAANAAAYPAVMSAMQTLLQRLFPGVCCLLSEGKKEMPWQFSTPSNGNQL